MNEEQSEGKPKIFVDEDWKARAQAEKEELSKEPRVQQESEPPPQERPKSARGPLPPASFSMLVSTLSTQALVCLGTVENPVTGKAEKDLDQSKHFIDTLQVLQEKTRGNLTPEEDALLESVLHELRMAYVQVASAGGAGAPEK